MISCFQHFQIIPFFFSCELIILFFLDDTIDPQMKDLTFILKLRRENKIQKIKRKIYLKFQ